MMKMSNNKYVQNFKRFNNFEKCPYMEVDVIPILY